MKKLPSLMAALALTTLSNGCEKKSCLRRSYDATVELIQEFNQNRCRAMFDEDLRHVDCPVGTLTGEINERGFVVELEGLWGSYRLDDTALEATCGREHTGISDENMLREIRGKFLEVLREMEVD